MGTDSGDVEGDASFSNDYAGLKISEIQMLIKEDCSDRKLILESALRRIIAQKNQKEKEIEKLQELIRDLR